MIYRNNGKGAIYRQTSFISFAKMIHIPETIFSHALGIHLFSDGIMACPGLSSQAFEYPAGSHRASENDLRDSFQASFRRGDGCEV